MAAREAGRKGGFPAALGRFFGAAGRGARPRPLPARHDRFRLERLEPRLLLSATPAALAAAATAPPTPTTTLTVNIGATRDITLRVASLGDDTKLQVLKSEDLSVLSEQNLPEDNAASPVLGINVVGTGGEDRVAVDRSVMDLPQRLLLNFDGGGGNDTLAGPAGNIVWVLGAGGAGGFAQEFTPLDPADPAIIQIARFTGVETLESGDGDDHLFQTGGGGQTWAVNRSNDVTLYGVRATGIERLQALAGDRLSYAVPQAGAFADGVFADLTEGAASGFRSIAGFTHLTGSAFADTLIGDAQANIIFGLDGDDSISGEAGNDLLDGGTGTNRLLEARDADFTLSDAQLLIGAAETDTLFNFASADLTGGVGANRLDASLFTGTGGVFLDGGGGNDTLIGSGRNDLLTGGAGADAIDGGGGLDTIVEDVDLDTVLTNGTLAIAGVLDTLTGVEQASIVGGDRGNLLDASAFSLGAVTLIGGEGNDRLLGGGGDDWLAPLGGLDSVAGGAGTDRLVAQGLRRGVLTDTGFDKGAGTLAIWTLSVSGSGRFTVGDGTDVTTSIAVGALASEVALALTRLRSLGEGNVAVASVSGGYLVAIGGALAGQAGPDLSLAAASGAPVLGAARTTAAVTRQDTISGIERAELRGTALADVLDARGFTGGPVTLLGSAGSDTLYGGSGADSIVAGGGDDEVNGGGGADTLLGGEGVDRLLATGAGDVVLNNTTLTRTIAGVVTAVSLTGFEAATLVGDGGANRLDARGFNGISLDTPVALLSPDGIFPAEPEVDDGPVPGGPTDPIPTRPDLVVTVTIGSDVRRYEVQLSGSAVVEDLVDSFNALAEPLTGTTTPDFVASFDAANGRIVLAAATGATLSVQAISAAAPLIGFTGTRSGATLQGEAMRGAGVRLEGLVGNDTLLGSGGDDTLAGGGGTNSLDGGAGTDTVLHETAPGDVTLEPTRLRVRAIGSATVLEDSALLGIERAILRGSGATGGATLNAGAFTGDVIFRDLGDDTVTGGGGTNRYALRAANNQPIAQPTIDVAAGGQSLFQIFVPSDVTLTQAMVNDGLALMPAPLNFPPLLPGTPPIITSQLEFYGTSITVSEA
nr:LEPR-XLL domain-containing protein [Rubritepida sp.]